MDSKILLGKILQRFFDKKEIDQLFSESRKEIKEIYSKLCETSKKMDLL